jgi:hypothetical protein
MSAEVGQGRLRVKAGIKYFAAPGITGSPAFREDDSEGESRKAASVMSGYSGNEIAWNIAIDRES